MSDTIYVIVPTAEVTNAMINSSVNQRLANVRKSNDETLCLFKVEDSKTSPFINYEWYTAEEILVEIENGGWDG